MKKTSTAIYSMSMSVLYTVLKWAINLYLKYVDDFTAFSDTYSKEWGEQMLKAINEAQAMPNISQRNGNTKNAGNKLDVSSKAAVHYWKMLRRFIIKAFTSPADLEAALQQAGGAHYNKAAGLNFGEIALLMTAGQVFLQQNLDVLTAAGMPATFSDNFSAAKEDFDAQHTQYGEAKSDATDGTSEKIDANNALYTEMMSMFGDAQTIFADRKSIQAQFNLRAVKRIVTKDAPSGIHFMVKDSTTKKPLITASIVISNSPDPQTVNNRGALELKLPKGIYSYSVTTPGYTPVTGIITIDSSGMRRLPVEMSQAESTAAAS